MQNDWVLLDENQQVTDETNGTTLETYLGDAYVLPDSAVFLFQRTDENFWKIWNGFRAGKSGPIRTFEIGTTSTSHLNISDLNGERRDFRGITLKANTVVCAYLHTYNTYITVAMAYARG